MGPTRIPVGYQKGQMPAGCSTIQHHSLGLAIQPVLNPKKSASVQARGCQLSQESAGVLLRMKAQIKAVLQISVKQSFWYTSLFPGCLLLLCINNILIYHCIMEHPLSLLCWCKPIMSKMGMNKMLMAWVAVRRRRRKEPNLRHRRMGKRSRFMNTG